MKIEAQDVEKQESLDPRILRSRRMLMDAMASLLKRKDFSEISIQDIAEESTLNRATFYLHYPDKKALLQALTAVRFQELARPRSRPPRLNQKRPKLTPKARPSAKLRPANPRRNAPAAPATIRWSS